MKIEILQSFRHLGAGYTKGDAVTVDDAAGEYFCSVGWAKDIAGKVKTGELVGGASRIQPDPIVMGVNSDG